MKPQKILIVVTQGCIGGAQRVVADLAREYTTRGLEVVVMSGAGDHEFLSNTLAERHIPTVIFPTLARTINLITNLRFIFALRKFLNEHPFDVVHFHSTNALFGAIGAKLSRTKPKTIFTFHGLSFLDPRHRTNIFARLLYWIVFKKLLWFVDVPVFVTAADRDYAKRAHLTSRGVVIANGITPPRFLHCIDARVLLAKKISFSIGDDQLVIGSIGRLAYPKNYEFLIQQFPALLAAQPNLIGVIIGDGPERTRYQSLISRLGVQQNFFLVGAIHDAARYLPAFDIFVLPSLYEGLSITLLEAMAAERPIIASAVAGTREALSDAGLIYPIDDGPLFVDCVTKLLGDASLRATIGARAKKQSKTFSLEKMAENYIRVYN